MQTVAAKCCCCCCSLFSPDWRWFSSVLWSTRLIEQQKSHPACRTLAPVICVSFFSGNPVQCEVNRGQKDWRVKRSVFMFLCRWQCNVLVFPRRASSLAVSTEVVETKWLWCRCVFRGFVYGGGGSGNGCDERSHCQQVLHACWWGMGTGDWLMMLVACLTGWLQSTLLLCYLLTDCISILCLTSLLAFPTCVRTRTVGFVVCYFPAFTLFGVYVCVIETRTLRLNSCCCVVALC